MCLIQFVKLMGGENTQFYFAAKHSNHLSNYSLTNLTNGLPACFKISPTLYTVYRKK